MGIWGNGKEDSKGIEGYRLEEVLIGVKAYRSILSQVAYVSSPITTGERYYQVLERYGVKTPKELAQLDPDAFIRDIVAPNIKDGLDFALHISGITGFPIIAPVVFEAKNRKWTQQEYMFMWRRLIEEKVMEIHMKDGWEFSAGCTEEFVRAMEAQFGFINSENGMEHFPQGYDVGKEEKRISNIKAYAENGSEIKLDRGCELIGEAIKDLSRRGFDFSGLRTPLEKLVSISEYFYDVFTPSKECPPYEYDNKSMRKLFDELRALKISQ